MQDTAPGVKAASKNCPVRGSESSRREEGWAPRGLPGLKGSAGLGEGEGFQAGGGRGVRDRTSASSQGVPSGVMFRVCCWGGAASGEKAGWKEVVLGMGSGQRAGAPACLGLSPCGWRYLLSREQGRRPGLPRYLGFTGRVGHGVCGLQERPTGNGVILLASDPGVQSDPGSSLGVGCGAWRWCWEGHGAEAAPGDALFLSTGVPGSPSRAQVRDREPLGGASSSSAPAEVQVCRGGPAWGSAMSGGEGGGGRRPPTEEWGGAGVGGSWTTRQKGTTCEPAFVKPAWLSTPCPWLALADPGLCRVRRAARRAGGSPGHIAEVSARGVWSPQQGPPLRPAQTTREEGNTHQGEALAAESKPRSPRSGAPGGPSAGSL